MAQNNHSGSQLIQPDFGGYFVTGSDTDVGKTFISTQLIQQLVARGITVETRKPAESGFTNPEKSDARLLQLANAKRESLDVITPHRYLAALAPHRAARLEDRVLTLQMLQDACRQTNPESLLVVEGAGGFFSPIAENGLNADIATALGLKVFIVVDDRHWWREPKPDDYFSSQEPRPRDCRRDTQRGRHGQ